MGQHFSLWEPAHGFAVRYRSFELFKLLHKTVSQPEVFPKKHFRLHLHILSTKFLWQ